MKNRTIKLFLAGFVALMLSSVVSAQTTYTYSEGLNAAKSGNKKAMLVICSNDDDWCKKTDAVISSDGLKDMLTSDFVLIRMNVEDAGSYPYGSKSYSGTDLAKYFGATGYPTYVFLNPDGTAIKFKYNGEEVSGLPGYLDESELNRVLTYFKDNKYKDTDISTMR